MVSSRNMIKALVLVFVLFASVCALPFIVPSTWDYNAVIRDAARLYGINEDEFNVTFINKPILNAATGEESVGLWHFDIDNRANGIHNIQIQKSISRPMAIATIFHEFAHAAQYKYKLQHPNYTTEQHAELMAFNTMWNSKYWWNATHMLTMHTIKLKPAEYRVTNELWNCAMTGTNVMGFRPLA